MLGVRSCNLDKVVREDCSEKAKISRREGRGLFLEPGNSWGELCSESKQ